MSHVQSDELGIISSRDSSLLVNSIVVMEVWTVEIGQHSVKEY